VLFFINLAMDYLLMTAAASLLRVRRKRRRRLFGAALAALAYCAVVLFLPYSPALAPAIAMLLLALGLAAAFCPIPVMQYLRLLAATAVLALGAGGVMTALGLWLNPFGPARYFSIRLLAAGTLAAYGILRGVRGYLQAAALEKQTLYAVSILIDGAEATLTALADTGNSLADPLTQAPVLVAEQAAVLPALPVPLRALLRNGLADDLPALLEAIAAANLAARLRMLPFASVGAPHGMLLGLRTDAIYLHKDGHSLAIPGGIVALCREPLSGGAYNALLPPAMLDTL